MASALPVPISPQVLNVRYWHSADDSAALALVRFQTIADVPIYQSSVRRRD
jgi:hypothetical protein